VLRIGSGEATASRLFQLFATQALPAGIFGCGKSGDILLVTQSCLWKMPETTSWRSFATSIISTSSGKVIHECVTDGSIYFGTNAQNGDVNETAEFATAAATLWLWSGDNSVRDDS
jgi:hypothetical protein